MFYWTQVCMAVDHIHTSGIIHKDIKAKNVLLCLNQGELHRAKLSDFDSAMWLEQEFTAPGLMQAGTRGFAAPEVMEKEPHGRPADIHSLGVLLFELMGGVPPIDNRTTLKKRVKDLGQISPDVKQIVERCIQDDPTLRPTVKDLLADDFLKQYQQVSSEV
ncbi:predicted protein [Nematostella vectensis]|uniref:Protein kinase domain-containing protein n=2 Tax=Nematostella vectensis TaxID=45351 RepID=A7S0B0_NEMVE|nr:predicted protein [Nematostella vectensis]|eukprot:XP_001634865.1 predicted protein [Nematostella vectensis]